MYIPVMYKYKQKVPISGLVNGIQINLLEDLDKFCDKKLTEMGVLRKNPDDPTMDYCRFMRRIIDTRPRNVYKAKDFKCPIEYEQKLCFLQLCIEKGKNLNPFLTKSIKHLKNEDAMLYDWNIFHFHISDEIDKKSGFMKRSAYLLMAVVKAKEVYFIDVVSHDENRAHLWANKKYIQIIRDNWPELIERNLIKDAKLTERVDESMIYQLRNKGISTFTELDGEELYGLIGGGYASDGSSIKAVRQADRLRRIVGDAENVISKYFWLMRNDSFDVLKGKGVKVIPHLRLIGMGDNCFILIEKNMRIMINMKLKKNTWHISFSSFEKSFLLFCGCKFQ